MAKHAPSSIDSALPAPTYSTRSSIRRPLNLKTDIPSHQPFTDQSSTPSTPSTDLSTDLQKSPASSQTSSNIVDSSSIHISPSQTIMPPNAKVVKGAGPKSTSAQTKYAKVGNDSAPDTAAQTTENKADRPGRARKPTQKAAELAANRSSKLFKSITERHPSKEVEEDEEDSSDEIDPLAMDEIIEDEVKPTVSPKKTAPASVKPQAATKPISPSFKKKPAKKIGGRKVAKTPAATTASKKRKRTEDPEDFEEIPQKKTKTASTSTRNTEPMTPDFSVVKCGRYDPRYDPWYRSSEKSEDFEEAPVKKTNTTSTSKRINRSKTPAAPVGRQNVCTKGIPPDTPTEEPEDLEESPANRTDIIDESITKSVTPASRPRKRGVCQKFHRTFIPAADSEDLEEAAMKTTESNPRGRIGPGIPGMPPPPCRDQVTGKLNIPTNRYNAATITAETREHASSVKKPAKEVSPEPTKPTNKAEGKPITNTTTKPNPNHPTEPTSITTPTTLPTPTPRKFKLKLSPSIASALEGVTGIPCALSCLQPDQLIYAYAKIITEEEGLVDEVTSFPEFDGDVSRRACALRHRWNVVLAGYCECGRSEGVVNGGWKGSWEK